MNNNEGGPMIDPSAMEWAGGVIMSVMIALMGHFQVSLNSLRTEVSGLRDSMSIELDRRFQVIRDDLVLLRNEVNTDRHTKGETLSRIDRTMVTRTELSEQIDRVLREFDRKMPMPTRRKEPNENV